MRTVPPETVGLSSSRLERIRPVMQGFVDRGAIPGISTLVYRRGQVAWFACQGKPAFDAEHELAADALFRIYSMSKPITAVAAMMLWERGLFGLYDPISTYIPSFAKAQVLEQYLDGEAITRPATREITIHDLFCHTSGLAYASDGSALGQFYHEQAQGALRDKTAGTTAALIDKLGTLPLLYSPGDSWHYSYATDVLGRLVEVVSGQSFGEYLQEQVFEPLGMGDTSFWVPEAKLARLTTLYGPNDAGEIVALDQPDATALAFPPLFESGGGGLVSTMADYLTFSRLLLGQGQVDGVRLLGRKTVALMASNHLVGEQLAAFQASGRPGQGYGLTMSVTLDSALTKDASSVGDFGWGGAASTRFRVDPAEEMVWLIMPQLMRNPGYPFLERYQMLVHSALL